MAKEGYRRRTREVKEAYGEDIYRIWGASGGGRILHYLKRSGDIERVKSSMSEKRNKRKRG